MSELIRDFFHTEWNAMTTTGWTGLAIVIVLFFLMLGLYVWVFAPSNRDKLEQYRDFVVRDEEMDREVEHGHSK